MLLLSRQTDKVLSSATQRYNFLWRFDVDQLVLKQTTLGYRLNAKKKLRTAGRRDLA